ncbi:MAG: FG-GAP-like repeat-containing protein, partial [Ferruginibacter sp.]
SIINRMPEGKVNNYIFKGTDSLKFINKSTDWGIDGKSFSNGAVYADLDNDGDLDIVINNINAPATILRNNTVQKLANHFLEIQLKGDDQNRFGIGAKVLLKQANKIQYSYLNAAKGFESASLQYIHFGTGTDSVIDEVQVLWPGGRTQLLKNVKANQLMAVSYKDASVQEQLLPGAENNSPNKLFTDISGSIQLPFRHQEDDFNDFNVQSFIPHMISTQGPKLAVADVNGDGLEDFFICGAKNQPGALFQQTHSGKFISTNRPLFDADAAYEDVNTIFFDADGDGDKDLYVVSGGNESQNDDSLLLDRLYLNDGKGKFSKSNALPHLFGNKSVVTAADFDRDGDMDLFIGGRAVSGRYGKVPDSYLMLNDGKGHFTVAGDLKAPGLHTIGMVTDAVWADIDKDGWADLVIVGEWMPITIFKNLKGNLTNKTEALGLQYTTGLWNTIHAADINNDGAIDLLAGNLGENSKLHGSSQYPLKLFTGDFDNNGSLDQVLAVENKGEYYPFLGKEELEKELPALMRKKYENYSSFAGQTVDQIFDKKLEHSKLLTANMLSSVLLMNDGKGYFKLSNLPIQAQWSSVYTFLTGDFNADHQQDIITGGNFYGVLPYEGRYDAGYGMILEGNGAGRFNALSPFQSGLMVTGEIRDIKKIKLANGHQSLLIARNNDTPVFVTW